MRRQKLVIIMVSVSALMVVAFVLCDYLARRRAFAGRTACVGTLVRLRMAKLAYAESHGLTNGAVIPDDVVWREVGKVEHCHAGGRYSINAVDVAPSCSYTSVVLWKGRLWKHSLAK